MNRAVPRTTSSMPSVTRNEGILSRVTNQPLTKPISAAADQRDAGTPAPAAATPVLNSVHITHRARSRTPSRPRGRTRPAVISSVIGSAIRPSSTVKVSVLLMLRSDRNCGLIAENTTSSRTSRTNGPNSGRAIRRWRSGRCSTAGSSAGGVCEAIGHEPMAPRPCLRGCGLLARQDVVVDLCRVLLVEGTGDDVEARRDAAEPPSPPATGRDSWSPAGPATCAALT